MNITKEELFLGGPSIIETVGSIFPNIGENKEHVDLFSTADMFVEHYKKYLIEEVNHLERVLYEAEHIVKFEYGLAILKMLFTFIEIILDDLAYKELMPRFKRSRNYILKKTIPLS